MGCRWPSASVRWPVPRCCASAPGWQCPRIFRRRPSRRTAAAPTARGVVRTRGPPNRRQPIPTAASLPARGRRRWGGRRRAPRRQRRSPAPACCGGTDPVLRSSATAGSPAGASTVPVLTAGLAVHFGVTSIEYEVQGANRPHSHSWTDATATRVLRAPLLRYQRPPQSRCAQPTSSRTRWCPTAPRSRRSRRSPAQRRRVALLARPAAAHHHRGPAPNSRWCVSILLCRIAFSSPTAPLPEPSHSTSEAGRHTATPNGRSF